MGKKLKAKLKRVLIALAFFVVFEALELFGLFNTVPNGIAIEFFAFLIPYLIAGYDVLRKAARGIVHRQPFDENLLMSIATIGAFALVFFPDAEPHMAEGAAVMIFYQIGTIFESYAVGKTRSSIAKMMDIAPEYANVVQGDELLQVDPYDVAVGTEIVCKPGERIPLDGDVVEGTSQIDTSALTGESIPQVANVGSHVTSGCVNMTGKITVLTTSAYENSTVARILELVENASEKKARAENFITRFARVYTPAVVGCAVLIAALSPLIFGHSINASVQAALIFLVVSCPCALVISVPLSFFGGIGAASRNGILVKGSSYLEALGSVGTVAFDKTGTLTSGTFGVIAIHAHESVDKDQLLSYAAHAEAYSDHPIALSVVSSYTGEIDRSIIADVEERGGLGVSASIAKHRVVIGNDRLMETESISVPTCKMAGTILHVAIDGAYLGHIVIADMMKDDAKQAIDDLHHAGVKNCVMLTGDRVEVAQAVAEQLGIDDFRAQLMPHDKVSEIESLIDRKAGGGSVAFVGDGINDAPVLMRADVGIAMGAMGSDAAIEAADIVLMDDKPTHIALAIRIARKTLRIVRQNIVFALAVKAVIMVLALPFFGIATMWLAVFGDVGVSVLAILNAMRCLRVRNVASSSSAQ